jgi:hypothetical protein
MKTIAHEKHNDRERKKKSSADAEEEESGDGVVRQRMCGKVGGRYAML